MSEFLYTIRGDKPEGSFIPEFYLMSDEDGLNLCYTDSNGDQIVVLYFRSDTGRLAFMEDVEKESRLDLDGNGRVQLS